MLVLTAQKQAQNLLRMCRKMPLISELIFLNTRDRRCYCVSMMRRFMDKMGLSAGLGVFCSRAQIFRQKLPCFSYPIPKLSPLDSSPPYGPHPHYLPTSSSGEFSSLGFAVFALILLRVHWVPKLHINLLLDSHTELLFSVPHVSFTVPLQGDFSVPKILMSSAAKVCCFAICMKYELYW